MGNLGFSSPVFGMNKNSALWIAFAGGLLSIAAPIVFSIFLAWKHNLDNQIEFTDSIAKEVLRKSGESMIQIDSIHTTLANAGASDPCSPENIRLMGKLNLQSEKVQAVGFVKDNIFLCSAYGHHAINLGPPTFTTSLGTKVWTSHELPILPGTKFLVVAPKAMGYAMVILPKVFLNIFADDPHVSVGLYSLSAKTLIVSRGAFEPQWLERLGKEQQVQFIDKDNFVVVRTCSKSSEHQRQECQVHKLQAGIEPALAVLPQPPIFLQPRKAALNNPALGYHRKLVQFAALGYLYRHILA